METEFKDVAIKASKIAGDILMKYYSKNIQGNLKDNSCGHEAGSVVTKADLESEEKIIKILKDSFPTFGIYGEESGGQNINSDFVWYIDPLDGTSNFIRHIPLFGISIGLVHLGQPILGVLYFPALNLLLYAEKGKGCFANDCLVKVSNRSLSESLYYSAGKYKGQQQVESWIAKECGLIKIIDSSSYEFAQIAMGDAEIYYFINVPHDVVAGVCIVREAGGIVTDGLGGPWQLDSKKILATNGLYHKEIVENINIGKTPLAQYP